MPSDVIKISANVPDALHKQAAELAQAHKTTIGNMAVFGLSCLVRNLKSNPKLARKITPDPRRK